MVILKRKRSRKWSHRCWTVFPSLTWAGGGGSWNLPRQMTQSLHRGLLEHLPRGWSRGILGFHLVLAAAGCGVGSGMGLMGRTDRLRIGDSAAAQLTPWACLESRRGRQSVASRSENHGANRKPRWTFDLRVSQHAWGPAASCLGSGPLASGALSDQMHFS